MTRIQNVELNTFRHEFIDNTKEYIDDTDIEYYAKQILREVEHHRGNAKFIVQGLDESTTLAYMYRMGVIERREDQLVIDNGDREYVPVPTEEIFHVIDQIRKAVHEKILNIVYSRPELGIDPTDIALVERPRHMSGNIQELLTTDRSSTIHKRLLDTGDHRISRLAIERLMHLPDHPAVRKPSYYDERTGETLMPEYSMSVLSAEWVEDETDTELPKLFLTQHELLQVMIDAISGAEFLLQHDLIIQDIHSSNIAIDRETRRGFLFDFDQLIKTSQHPEEIYRPIGYVDSPGYIPSYEREMITTFGDVLYEMSKNIEFGEPAATELRRLHDDTVDAKVGCVEVLRRLRTIQSYIEA